MTSPEHSQYLKPFNPLDYNNLTKHVVDELMRRGPYSLPLASSFRGAGVYALFYMGNNPEYSPIKSFDATKPIYVGKAVPAGSRKGLVEGRVAIGTVLYKRLSEHCDSITAAHDLSLADFSCRYLVVEPLWIVMAEQFLIRRFRPLWNIYLDGFGNHDPGSGRHAGEVTWWDAMHPGRRWATRLRQTKTKEQAKERIRAFFLLDERAIEENARRTAAHEGDLDE